MQKSGIGRTPRSDAGTPSILHGRRDDETGSQLSKLSHSSQYGKSVKITYVIPNKNGKDTVQEKVIHDPKVISAYMRRRRAKEMQKSSILDYRPTGNAEYDARQRKALEAELARLERNKERRFIREKAKGLHPNTGSNPTTPGSPSASTPAGKGLGTQRKCANCGRIGHIKTNKKLCPLLNGEMTPEPGFNNAAFASPTGAFGSTMSPPASTPTGFGDVQGFL